MKEDPKTPSTLPAKLPTPVTRPYSKPAGGMGAIWSTVKECSRHPGLLQGAKALLKVNQPEGFDCPGCAWPDPPASDRSAFEFCENGAKAVAAETTRKRVTPEFFKTWPISKLLGQSDYWLEAQGRLTHPMYKAPGSDHYAPIAWSDAFERIAGHLKALDHPDEAVFYSSGRTSNEAAFLYQLLARQLGTNNLPDCSNLCHESSGKGLGASIGIGKGTVTLQDFDAAEAIFVIGQNPGTNHPRMLSALESAAKGGCKIVSVNPLRERGLERFAHPQHPLALLGRGTAISTHYLQVRINGDVALLKGIAKAVLDREDDAPGTVLDHAFIKAHTTGLEAVLEDLRATEWSLIERESGIARAQIEQVADVYCASNATIICWAMGLTQHRNGVDNIKMVVNLLLMRGNLGKPGAGACPVRGHSNVQGDRTVGIVSEAKPAFLKRLGDHYGFQAPTKHGYEAVDAIEAMHKGEAKVFVAMGGNFVLAAPDTHYTAAGLSRCRLTVQVSTKLNRGHLITGDEALILPCLGRTERDEQAGGEQFVTVENSMGIVHRSRGRRKPPSEHLLSEPAIVAGLGAALAGDSPIPWSTLADDYGVIRDGIEAVIPGFENYNTRVLDPSGFVLPNGPRDRVWNTKSGKAEFNVVPIPELPLADGQYLMMTIRTHDQYNTTIYGNDDRYRGIFGKRRVIMMSPDDISAAGLVEGQAVDLISHYEGEQREATDFVVATQSLPRGCVATYFPEANALVPAKSYARLSKTPTSKSVIVSLRPR